MKRQSWKNQNTEIELTSLLDVIFIVLMIVLCNQQINMQAKTDAAAEREALADTQMEAAGELMEKAESLREEALLLEEDSYVFASEKILYEEQLRAYEEMHDEVLSIVLYADYLPTDLRTRTVRILAGSDGEAAYTLTPGLEKDVFGKVRERLEQLISENEEKPVVITLSTEKILYRDEESLNEMLSDLGSRYENLYIRNKN